MLKSTKQNFINLNLDSIITDKIVVSDKFRHGEEGFKYLLVIKKIKIFKG